MANYVCMYGYVNNPSAKRIWLCIRLNNAGKWDCDRLTEDVDFSTKNHVLDEAHFDLGGHLNNQNCNIWATENPHTWSRGTVGPFFFEGSKIKDILNIGNAAKFKKVFAI